VVQHPECRFAVAIEREPRLVLDVRTMVGITRASQADQHLRDAATAGSHEA
jgi:hypothetical protein